MKQEVSEIKRFEFTIDDIVRALEIAYSVDLDGFNVKIEPPKISYGISMTELCGEEKEQYIPGHRMICERTVYK